LPYRRFGWEEVGALTWRTLPPWLWRTFAAGHIACRPAAADDVPAVLDL